MDGLVAWFLRLRSELYSYLYRVGWGGVVDWIGFLGWDRHGWGGSGGVSWKDRSAGVSGLVTSGEEERGNRGVKGAEEGGGQKRGEIGKRKEIRRGKIKRERD